VEVDINDIAPHTFDVPLPAELDRNSEEGAEERPAWLPPNFNDPADLAKSWRDSQAALTRANQEAAAERAARQELEQQVEEWQQMQAEAPDADDYEAFREGVHRRDWAAEFALRSAVPVSAQQVVEQNAPAVIAQAEAALSATMPDWETLKPRVAELIGSRPDLLPMATLASAESTTAAFAAAAEIVRGQDAQIQYSRHQQKMAALTMTGGSVVREPAPTAWDAIANAGRGDYASLIKRGGGL
jgi:hypothetical protein